MCYILLATENSAKFLAGNILTTKYVRLQTEYMGTRKTRVTLHGVSLFITGDHLEFFFVKFGKVNDVSAVKSKAGITGDVKIMMTINRRIFMDIPNVLNCGANKSISSLLVQKGIKSWYPSPPVGCPKGCKNANLKKTAVAEKWSATAASKSSRAEAPSGAWVPEDRK